MPASPGGRKVAPVDTKPDTELDAEPVTLCRDCLTRFAGKAGRCPKCGGPRLVSHPELLALSIAHIDCDAFYATVEKRDNPSLADRPVIVGGGHRGVVSAACYVARTYGVRSAMPMFKALKACPEAVVIPPDMAKYASVGRQVREMMLKLTPAVEPLSIDEAFLDLSGTERLHAAPPAVVLARFQIELEREIGVTASVGLSHSKFLAKIASDLDKPRGFAVIGRAETLAFLAAQPVSVIWGVGAKTQERLVRDGFRRLADLQKQDERRSRSATAPWDFGSRGWRAARTTASSRPERKAKSISAETTFDTDYAKAEDLMPRLRTLSERVAARMKRRGPRRPAGRAEAEERRLPPAHAQRPSRPADLPRRPHLPRRPRPAEQGARRHEIPADRHRRRRAWRRDARRGDRT